MYRDVILITTHKINPRVINLYHKIRNGVGFNSDVILLVQDSVSHHIPFGIRYLKFTKEELFSQGLRSITDSITPGSNHFILLWFFTRHTNYDRFWVIEYDVEFSGNWGYFFYSTYFLKYDFLATHIKTYNEDPGWFWWGSLGGQIANIPYKCRVRSFNPVMRISREALFFLHDILCRDGNCGHHEEAIATILYKAGFSLCDLGTSETFSSQTENATFCTYTIPFPYGTMRDKPIFNPIVLTFFPDKLIHPIKSEMPIIQVEE